MKSEKELSVYSYGINKFTLCYNKQTKQIEDDLLILHYGQGKKFVFKIDKAFELVCAIQGTKNPNGSVYDYNNFKFDLKFMDIVQMLNSRLAGRAIAMVTTFKNNAEYINKVQNEVVGITGYDLDGHLIAKSTNELFNDGFANYDTDIYCEPPKDYVEDATYVA